MYAQEPPTAKAQQMSGPAGTVVPAVLRIVVAGSRSFSDYGALCAALDPFIAEHASRRRVVIVSGAARGADELGERYAREHGYAVERYPAQWERFGLRAGYVRNMRMAEVAGALVAFWDGLSRGTAMTIDLARRRGLDVRVVRF